METIKKYNTSDFKLKDKVIINLGEAGKGVKSFWVDGVVSDIHPNRITVERKNPFGNELLEEQIANKLLTSDYIVKEEDAEMYADGGEVNEFDYMMLGRLKSDADYYLGYGNRNEKRLWALNVDDHIKEMKNRWNALPEDKKPEWLTMEDILEYEKKMKNPTKSKFSYYKVPNEELYAIQECNPEYKDGFGSECIVIRTKKTEEAAIAEVERLNKLGYSDYAKGGELPQQKDIEMKILTSKEYYDMSNELDYVIPSDNVADCKLQMRIDGPDGVRTLYGMNEDADQFMLSPEMGEDTFFIETSLDEVLDVLGVAHEEYKQGGELPQQKNIDILQKGLENPLTDGGSVGKREYTEAEKWWGNDLSTNEQKEYAKKHLENFEYSELMGSTSQFSTASRRKKFITEIWEKEGRPKSIIPGIYANGGEVNEFNYMMLGRLKSDADYYLGYGNRNEKHLWALNVDDHIKEMKDRWNALPEDKKPEWLTMEDILEYEQKMKNPTKSKFSYYKVPNEELYAIQECNPEYKDGFGSECIVIRTKKTEEAAITEVERLNKLGYSDYAKGGELPQQKNIDILQKGLENPLIPQNVKTKIEAKIKELQAEITKKQEEAKKAAEKPTLKDLEARLKIVKKMASKKPELKARVKIIEKMIAKEEKNKPSKEEFIDLNIDNISDELKKDAAFYFSDKYNLTKIDLMDELVRYTQMQKDFDAKKITPSQVIGKGHKPQYARGIADKWIKDRIALTKYLIKNFDELNQLTETQKKATPKMENGGEFDLELGGYEYKMISSPTISYLRKEYKEELKNPEYSIIELPKQHPDRKRGNKFGLFKKKNRLTDHVNSFRNALVSYIKDRYNEDVDLDNTLISYIENTNNKQVERAEVTTLQGNEYTVYPADLVDTFKNGGEIKKEDIEILGIPRNKISEKEWKSILSMAKHQQGATFILKDEKGLDVEPQIEYEWYVKDRFKNGGSIPVNIALQKTVGEPYEIIKNDIPRTEAQKFIEEYKQSGKPYHNIMIDDLPFEDGGEIPEGKQVWVWDKNSANEAIVYDTHYLKSENKVGVKYTHSGVKEYVPLNTIELMEKGGETWIQDATKQMEKKGTVGSFTNKAARHGLTPVEYAKKVLANPDKHTEKTRRQAQFVKNTNPEKFN